MAPRQARAEATRQGIIDAAVQLFGEFGYADTDMTDVVERARTTGEPATTTSPPSPHSRRPSSKKPTGGSRRKWRRFGESAPHMHRLIAATFRFIAVTENNPVVRVGYQLRQATRQSQPLRHRQLRRHRDGIRLIHQTGPCAKGTHAPTSILARRPPRCSPHRSAAAFWPTRSTTTRSSVWRRCGERPALHRIGGRAARIEPVGPRPLLRASGGNRHHPGLIQRSR